MSESVAIAVLVGSLVAVHAGFFCLLHMGCKPRVLEQYVILATRGTSCLAAVIVLCAGTPYALDAVLNLFEAE